MGFEPKIVVVTLNQQLLKLDHLTGLLIRRNLMEKVCKKPAIKTSPIPL